MDNKDHIEKFVKKALDWELWVEKADELIEVASLIKPSISEKAWNEKREKILFKEHYFTIYFMLMSYALENLLKALHIKNDPEIRKEIEQKRKIPNTLKSHNLFALSRDFDLVWGDDYVEALLKRMFIIATWFGRYPIPVKATDMKSFIKLENADYRAIVRSYNNMAVPEIDKIIASVYAKLGKQPPKSSHGSE